MSRSTEHLNESNNHAIGEGNSSKAILSDPYDVGALLTDRTLSGLSLRHRQDETLCGLAWSHRELTVRFIFFLLSILISLRYSNIGPSP